jgi:hypothetical protein
VGQNTPSENAPSDSSSAVGPVVRYSVLADFVTLVPCVTLHQVNENLLTVETTWGPTFFGGDVDVCEAGESCEDLPLPLAHVGDKKVKRFHFSEIIGRLPYMRATVTNLQLS